MRADDDEKLRELRDILTGIKSAKVVPLRPPTMAAARDSLPGELRPHFDKLVADFHAAVFAISTVTALPDYRVLAELARSGWRKV
jgi:hypothetical protein